MIPASADLPLALGSVQAATVFTVISGLGTLAWLLAYVLVVRRGFLDRTYGMPLAALAANIGNELIFAVVHPAEGLLRWSNFLWAAVDVVIVCQVIRYVPRELPSLGARWSRLTVPLAIAVATVLQLSFIAEFDDYGGAYCIFGINVMMSLCFVQMALARGDRRGQSIPIAVAKLVGTALFSLAMFFFSRDDFARGPLLTVLYVVCLVADVAYVALLRRLPAVRA